MRELVEYVDSVNAERLADKRLQRFTIDIPDNLKGIREKDLVKDYSSHTKILEPEVKKLIASAIANGYLIPVYETPLAQGDARVVINAGKGRLLLQVWHGLKIGVWNEALGAYVNLTTVATSAIVAAFIAGVLTYLPQFIDLFHHAAKK
jgi:hypothetical protein